VALALLLLLPAGAFAAEEEFEGVIGGFTVKASNGYRLAGIVYSDHADGRGDLIMVARRKGRAVLYSTTATVTKERLAVDLGDLGRIDMHVVPTGRKERLRPQCGEDRDGRLTVEEASYVGSFEFHGEEAYTGVTETRIPVDYRFYADGLCGGVTEGMTGGSGLPGARLRADFRGRADRLELEVMKNRPSAPTRVEASVAETDGAIGIRRAVDVMVGAGAFRYDAPLRSATVEPPAPFDGSASFHRYAHPGNRWSGNLTVDFPGRSDVPLTDASRINLVRGQWSRHVTQYAARRLGW
jgi:hypothetical protein